MVKFILCNEGFGSTSFTEWIHSWRISGKTKMLWQVSMELLTFPFVRKNLCSAFATAIGLWVEAKLVSQVIPPVSLSLSLTTLPRNDFSSTAITEVWALIWS